MSVSAFCRSTSDLDGASSHCIRGSRHRGRPAAHRLNDTPFCGTRYGRTRSARFCGSVRRCRWSAGSWSWCASDRCPRSRGRARTRAALDCRNTRCRGQSAVSIANPKRLTSGRESVDTWRDGRSLQAGLVRRGRTVSVANCIASRNLGAATPTQHTAAQAPKRSAFNAVDRLVFAGLYRLAPGVLNALKILKPDTVIRWHRAGFRAYLRWKSRPRGGRPTIPADICQLIREMSVANPLWGAPRIHGELLKLGIDIGQTTVAKYMSKRRSPPSQGWRTFLRNHRSIFSWFRRSRFGCCTAS